MRGKNGGKGEEREGKWEKMKGGERKMEMDFVLGKETRGGAHCGGSLNKVGLRLFWI